MREVTFSGWGGREGEGKDDGGLRGWEEDTRAS